MTNISHSPSPHLSSHGSRTSSPNFYRVHSSSNKKHYEVPYYLQVLLGFFLMLNIILFLSMVQNIFYMLPFIISLLCTFITNNKIDRAALVQAKKIKSSLSKEQVSSIIAHKNSPFVDNHVRAKLIATTKHHN